MPPAAEGNHGEPAQVIPASLRDLVERPLYAHLATVRPDGTPQVNATWFRFDGTHLWLTATTARRRDPALPHDHPVRRPRPRLEPAAIAACRARA